MEQNELREVLEGYEVELVPESRTFLLDGEINDELVRSFSSWKESLSELDSPVFMNINSPGGCADSMIAIIAMMEDFKEIHGHVLASAYSAALGIFASCHHRSMFKHAELMFHTAIYDPSAGNINYHKRQLKIAQKLQDKYEDIILSGSNMTKKDFKRSDDWYISKDEAIKLGLVNVI